MEKIIKELKEYGDRFEEVTKTKVPVAIRKDNYKLLWNAIVYDHHYLHRMVQVVTDISGKASFESNRIAGAVLMNDYVESGDFITVANAITSSYDSIKELGLRKVDEYRSEPLLELLLKRDDAKLDSQTLARLINIALSLEGASGYGQNSTRVTAEDAKKFKEAFLNERSPITNYRDLRYCILRNQQFESYFFDLVSELYISKSEYKKLINDIFKHLNLKIKRIGIDLNMYKNLSQVLKTLREMGIPEAEEIMGDILFLNKIVTGEKKNARSYY